VSAEPAGRTIVTAADHRYARTLAQLLLSAERHAVPSACRVVAFDLGLTTADRDRLAARFPWCQIERFAFDGLPPHARRLEVCAWKPVAIDATLRSRGGLVLWLDSACVIRTPLDAVFAQIERDGVLALAGQSKIERWCHERTLRFMRVPREHLSVRVRSAGVLGFDASRQAVRDLVDEWRRLALIPECIAPEGASRANHRYDQAILSNLLAAAGRDPAIRLAEDEIDISSIRPVGWVATRERVSPWVPLAFDPLVRAGYALYKAADRAVLRVRER
jgi:hypothetical protein